MMGIVALLAAVCTTAAAATATRAHPPPAMVADPPSTLLEPGTTALPLRLGTSQPTIVSGVTTVGMNKIGASNLGGSMTVTVPLNASVLKAVTESSSTETSVQRVCMVLDVVEGVLRGYTGYAHYTALTAR